MIKDITKKTIEKYNAVHKAKRDKDKKEAKMNFLSIDEIIEKNKFEVNPYKKEQSFIGVALLLIMQLLNIFLFFNQ